MKDISAIYQSIYPTLEVMEAKRKKTLRQGQNILFIALAAIALTGLIGFTIMQNTGEFPIPIFIIIGVTIIASGGIYLYKRSKLIKAYKDEVIAEIIQSIDDSFQYNRKGRISEVEFKESQLFQRPDRYNGEDYITGKLDKTDFKFSEIHAEYQTQDSEGDTSYGTIFKGLFMIADFHKAFLGHTVVLPDRTGEGWFGRMVKSSKKQGKQVAKMENPDFEKEFDVYTTDQVEARYILSMSMLENIMHLKKRFNSTIHIAFLNSCVYIAINWDKKFLEPNLKKSLLEESTIHQYLDDIWLCLEIIEELNLNTRIWTKT
jgi:LPXTG-motif cell wall-anchored protein